MKNPYEAWVIAAVLIVLFPYILLSTILEISIWIASKSWHGRLSATVKEIKRVRRSRGRGRGEEWFEIPIITYQVGDTTYTEEYSHAEKREGFYLAGQEIPILYNETNPKEFIIEGEYSDSDRFSCFIAGPVTCLVVLVIAADCFGSYYLSTHELLSEKETWQELDSAFIYHRDEFDFSLWDAHNMDALEERIEKTILHFRQIDKNIEQNWEKREYNDYRTRYVKAATRASRDLADFCSQCMSQFLLRCNLKEEDDAVWKSVYAGFLRQVCPGTSPPAGVYSMEEVLFIMETVAELQSSGWDRQNDPEESIGLYLAASCAGRHFTAVMLSYEASIKDMIVQEHSGFIPAYIEGVNEYLECRPRYGDNGSRDAYAPFDPESVYAVYDYTMERYFETGSFETALWDGAVFAQAHLRSRLQAHPDLGKLERLQDEHNFFADFDPQKGPDFYFHEDKEYRFDSLYYLYDCWEWCILNAQSRHLMFQNNEMEKKNWTAHRCFDLIEKNVQPCGGDFMSFMTGLHVKKDYDEKDYACLRDTS
ncbi:hypothetical protein D3Z50_20040 [Clostridiaceae bacterium]|nr:hypothetical protein [Clostridiaceae bacterium]